MSRARKAPVIDEHPPEPERRSRLELTDDEIDMLQRYADGQSTEDIAEAWGVNKQTVNNRKKFVYLKMDVDGIVPAVAKAFRDGIIE